MVWQCNDSVVESKLKMERALPKFSSAALPYTLIKDNITKGFALYFFCC